MASLAPHPPIRIIFYKAQQGRSPNTGIFYILHAFKMHSREGKWKVNAGQVEIEYEYQPPLGTWKARFGLTIKHAANLRESDLHKVCQQIFYTKI